MNKKIFSIIASIFIIASLSSCGSLYKKNKYERYVKKYFKKADLNNDGFISKKENKLYVANKFADMDLDKDNKISKEEVKEYKKSQRKKKKNKK